MLILEMFKDIGQGLYETSSIRHNVKNVWKQAVENAEKNNWKKKSNTVWLFIILYMVFGFFDLILSGIVYGYISLLIVGLNYLISGNSGMTHGIDNTAVGFWEAVGVYMLGLLIFVFILTLAVNVIYELVWFIKWTIKKIRK